MEQYTEGQLETRTYDTAQPADQDQQAIELFHKATAIGFYEQLPDAAKLPTYVELSVAQKLRFTLVFDRSAAEHSRQAAHPVHTYASFPGLLNAGGAAPFPVHKITAVTVAPTHRRRGLLSRQIRADLDYAQQAGFPLAALTASEATIYGRYGFEPATLQTRFTLKCAGGLKLRVQLPGTVVDIDPARFAEQYAELSERALAHTFGTVDGTDFDAGYALGRWDDWETLAEPKNLRYAAYFDEQGQLGGFVTYKFGGWDEPKAKMVVHKLIAASVAARLKLLEYVANHDLIEEVHGQGQLDDPLRHALADVRNYTVRSTEDVLWLRMLDVPAAFEARGYHRDGRLALQVADSMDLVTGTYLFDVVGGAATVHQVPPDAAQLADCPRVALGERELAGLYLGTVQLPRLIQLGRAVKASPVELGAAAQLFAVECDPFTAHGF